MQLQAISIRAPHVVLEKVAIELGIYWLEETNEMRRKEVRPRT